VVIDITDFVSVLANHETFWNPFGALISDKACLLALLCKQLHLRSWRSFFVLLHLRSTKNGFLPFGASLVKPFSEKAVGRASPKKRRSRS
jgi:hypothetical protein